MTSLLKKLFVAFLPLASIAVVVWLVVPAYQNIGEAKAEKEKAQSELDEKRALVEKVKGLETQFREVEEATRKVAEIVPPASNIPQLLVEFPALALQHGVAMKSIALNEAKGESENTSGGASPPPYKTLTANLSFQGTYETLKLFLRALEKDLRMMDVTSVEFNGGGDRDLISFTVQVKLYYGLTI